jgi:hypothetical protein
MRWGGMMAQQTQSDMYLWLQTHQSSNLCGGVWLSLDYTDFNKESTAQELQYLNECFARAWMEHPDHEQATTRSKAAAWTAKSYSARWASKGGQFWPTPNGLYSGHRDTMRDNTLQHKIYQLVQEHVARLVHTQYGPAVRTFICGDDEDTYFEKRDDALVYYGVGASMGWHFNPRKQMLSQKQHEFLQYMCNGDNSVTQPLVSTCVSYVNGNWYKDALIDAAGYAEGVMQLAAELVYRGADAVAVAATTREVINSWYKWCYGKNVRWDGLLSEQILNHSPFNFGRTIGPPSRTTDPPPELRSFMRQFNPPGFHAALQGWWPYLERLDKRTISRLLTDVKVETWKRWTTHAWNNAPPKPILTTGKVSKFAVKPIRLASLGQVLSIAEHVLDSDDLPTASKVAAILGIPLNILNCSDLTTISRNASAHTAGYLEYVPDKIPNQAHPMVRGLHSSVPWM